METSINIRSYDRRVDNRPAPYVYGGVFIRERNVPAGLTDKIGLRATVRPLAMPALRTGLRSMAGINHRESHSGELGFVLDKELQFGERPLAMSRTLRPSNRYPLPDALQAFKTYSSARFGGLRYKPLADKVVGIFFHSPLTLGKLFQMSFRTLRPRRLKFASDALITLARLLGFLRSVNLAVGVCRNIDNAEINSEPVFRCSRRRLFDVHRGEKKPFAAPKYEVGLALTGLQKLPRPVGANERDGLSSFGSPDGNLRVLPTKYPVVVGDGSERLVGSFRPFVELVGVGDLRYGADDHLSRKSRRCPHRVIAEFMEGILPELATFPRNPADFIRRRVGSAKRLLERASLFFRREELYLNGEFHALILPRIVKYREELRRAFLHQLKQVVSSPVSL